MTAYLLLLSLVAVFVIDTYAQSRPRRVGDRSSSTSQPSESTPQPSEAAPQPSEPTQAPVLRGNNRSPQQSETKAPEPTQSGPEEVDSSDVVRVNTTLVTLPVSVMDRNGRYVPNLNQRDFRIWEDEVEQEVAFFSSVDKPFSVVLMLDTSGSTRFRLEEIQDAAINFMDKLRPDDRVMIVSFDDDIRILSEFTSDRNQLRKAILRTRPGDGTKLYDAVDLVMNRRLNQVSGRKAIVLFTDGVDTTSRHASYTSNVRDAEELDALIYPVQYDTYMDVSGGGGWPGPSRVPNSSIDILGQILGGMGRHRMPRSSPGTSRADYEVANRYLGDLAEKTGARKYQGDTAQDLSSSFENIAEELRRQYSVGYYPKRTPEAGERRQIRVRVNQPNLVVRTRDTYVFNEKNLGHEDAAQKSAPVLRRKVAESGKTLDPNFN